MAEIQITRDELGTPAAWPKACAQCGEPAEQRVPLPKKKAGDAEGLEVPLCEQHLDHWAQHSSRTWRICILALVLTSMGTAVTWLFFPPPHPGNHWQGDAGRYVVPFVFLLVIGIPLAVYVGYPIHVKDSARGWITLGGLGGKFVSAWRGRPAPAGPSGEESIRFDVFPYSPDGVCPWPGTGLLFLGALTIGFLAGLAVGSGGVRVTALTQDWAVNDLRYLGIIAGLLFVQSILCLLAFNFVHRRAWQGLFRTVAALLALVVVLVLVAWGAVLFDCPLSNSTFIALYVLPAILVGVLTNSQANVQKIRSPLVAGMAGVAGTLVMLLGVWLSLRGSDIFSWLLVLVYAGVAVAIYFLCSTTAREPFCVFCDAWMQRRVLGALSRPAELCKEAVQRGEIARLAADKVYESADVGDVELAVYECPACEGQGQIVLHAIAVVLKHTGTHNAIDLVTNPKGTTKERQSLGYWVYPAAATSFLDKLFPKPSVGQHPDPDPSLQ